VIEFPIQKNRKNFVPLFVAAIILVFMSDMRCCFPIFRRKQRTLKTKVDTESSISSAASESALNDSTYDKLFADQNFLSSMLVQPGSVNECASVRESITDGNLVDIRLSILSSSEAQVLYNRELVTRERLVEEILKLRRALEVANREFKKTEDELKGVLIAFANEREANAHRGIFRSILNPLRHRKLPASITKVNRSGSCPHAALQLPPQSGLSSSSDPNFFSTIHYIVDPVIGS
jgi:hypothetical protein